MKRIEPGSVAAFFAARPDIRPLRRKFVEYRSPARNIVACCGASAALIAVDEGIGKRLDTSVISRSCRLIEETLDLSAEYIYGFILGWDGQDPGASLHDDGYDQGHEDGRLAYAATQQIRRVDP